MGAKQQTQPNAIVQPKMWQFPAESKWSFKELPVLNVKNKHSELAHF